MIMVIMIAYTNEFLNICLVIEVSLLQRLCLLILTSTLCMG